MNLAEHPTVRRFHESHGERPGPVEPPQRLHDAAAHAADPARGARDKNAMRHRWGLPVCHRQHEVTAARRSSGRCSSLGLGCAARS